MTRTIHAAKYAVFLFLASLLLACAQLGLPTANTFNERTAVAIGTVTQVRVTATALLKAGKLSSADGENVLKQTDNAAEAVTVARAIFATDPGSANSKLTAAAAILSILQQYLATKG